MIPGLIPRPEQLQSIDGSCVLILGSLKMEGGLLGPLSAFPQQNTHNPIQFRGLETNLFPRLGIPGSSKQGNIAKPVQKWLNRWKARLLYHFSKNGLPYASCGLSELQNPINGS